MINPFSLFKVQYTIIKITIKPILPKISEMYWLHLFKNQTQNDQTTPIFSIQNQEFSLFLHLLSKYE